jgi:hypothetical protein
MALNTNPFVEGIDPTSTFGGYASVLLQLIRQAIPSSTYGMILFDTTAPDVTGSNAWRKTCLWLSLANPAEPALYVYKTSSPGWVNINDIISPNSITTAMIQNNAVTLAKLSVAGGAANQLIRVNAGVTGFEFVSLSSLVTAGSIPVGSLITTGIPVGQWRFAGTFGPGVANWYTSQTIINDLVDGSIPTDLLSPAPGATTRSKFLTGRIGDTFAGWRFLEPNVDMLNDTLSGGKLQNGTVAPIKIESAGIPDGYLLSKVGGVPDWVAPLAVAGATTKFVNTVAQTITQAVPTVAGAGTSIAHTLGQIPTTYRVAFYCETAEHTYVQGDEIEILGIYRANGFSSDEQCTAYNIRVSSTEVVVQTQQSTWPIYAVSKTAGTESTALTPGNWRLRLYATYTA